jgi:hypothetical protein
MAKNKRNVEKISEISKRGRVPFSVDADLLAINEVASNATTQRGKLDIFYRLKALSTLGNERRVSWICDAAKLKAGEKSAWKPGILSELGKIEDRKNMLSIALEICELKPKTKDAIRMIRRTRLGPSKPGTAAGVHGAIINAINHYLSEHPDTSWDIVEEGLDLMAQSVEQSRQDSVTE